MAILEKKRPPTWNKPIGKVLRRIALVGIRILVNRTAGDKAELDKCEGNWVTELIEDGFVGIRREG